ncbi:MAG TPA: hemerythrin domain-containing protein [Polyangiaceae bacterium]|jgi:hemerythrin-like domain-containing protein|nr:hemerythrin domain-containing protein [Polyangiaceae bacterium]
MKTEDSRRLFLTLASTSLALAACRKREAVEHEPPGQPLSAAPSAAPAPKDTKEDKDDDADEVGAVEDLMREHGVIRRVLVVYRESAARLRAKPTGFPGDALQKSAQLMRTFGENYHEKLLEEAHLFPAVKKAGGAAASLIDPLIAQHQRGREISDYVIAITQQTIGAASAEPLARALEGFARMYEEHAAQEDTIVLPAWKKALSKQQLSEMGELFEDIEHKTFGKDGFDDASKQIAAIEDSLGIHLSALLAPPPPIIGAKK